MRIKYLACYDTEENKDQKRAFSPSSVPVIQSVCKSLMDVGCDVEIISFSSTCGSAMVPATRYLAESGVSVQLFQSFGRTHIVNRALNHLMMKIQYFFYLLFHIKKDDVVIAYHSPYYVNMLRLLKAIKPFRLVLQMLEIYADVYGDDKLKQRELKLAKAADGFIFATDILNRTINPEGKPAVVMLGTYWVEQDRGNRFRDDKIHVLYAGTLDPRKGGAAAAAAAAEFLPENYHIHILGFGSETEKQELMQAIENSSKPGHAVVTYDGLLSGEEFIRFVQACSIGLSTQNLDAQFNSTSFPSKILTYLANGLHVVSVRIKAVESSAVGDLIEYYDEQCGKSIAEAIKRVDLQKPFNGRKRLVTLAYEFSKDLSEMINRGNNESIKA